MGGRGPEELPKDDGGHQREQMREGGKKRARVPSESSLVFCGGATRSPEESGNGV
jgi:hypothetical protein